MDDTRHKRHVIIHGHFYQPPRENPWTERIDVQKSASPYHDWNERICRECYYPNATSRRLDGFGRVTKLVNNYEHISFNFGPTLLSWIEKKCASLYKQIINADHASSIRTGGHGNAIAQVYNHIIMPLAGRRDQETQIRWGIYDFEKRFGRRPEGIWLAETAINDLTIEILIDFGFRFVILSPFQADRIRPADRSRPWKSVASGSIPTGTPYRCYGARKKGKRSRKRFIDIFFYDAQLSTDISFNHLLSNGDKLAEAISSSFERCGGNLVTIATDGEIYGHHEPFGDMALAYLIDEAAEKHGLVLTNFAAYLSTHKPQHEVQIKLGNNNEGTAWSCSHGVKRWKEDCGCNTGSLEGWNQKWRKPLRTGLDGLRNRLAEIFENECGALLADPWEARDDYISLVALRNVENAEEFVLGNSPRDLSREEISRACKLLESQRHALLMFTSCGWFFSDISGIETVQLLRYAARAIELVGGKQAEKLEEAFLLDLDKAESNIPESGTGRDLYINARASSSAEPLFLAGQYALASHLSCEEASPEIFGYGFEKSDVFRVDLAEADVILGRLKMISPFTLERYDYEYLLIIGAPARVACMLKEYGNDGGFEGIKKHFASIANDTGYFDILAAAADYFGGHIFSMRDLFTEDREKILGVLAAKQISSVANLFTDMYMESREILRLFKETSLDPPDSLMAPSRSVLAGRLADEVSKWKKTLDPEGLEGIQEVITESEYYGIPVDKSGTSKIFTDFFLEKLVSLRGGLNAMISDQLHDFARFIWKTEIELYQHEIQNELFAILQTRVDETIRRLSKNTPSDDKNLRDVISFLSLAQKFNFNIGSWQERLPDSARNVV